MHKRIQGGPRAALSVLTAILGIALSACGGSDERLVDKYQLRPSAHISEFDMPMVEGADGWLENCIYLYVVAFVDAEQIRGPLPRDFKVSQVSISRANSVAVVWDRESDASDSYLETPTRYRVRAAGCSAGFTTGEKVNVKLRLAGDGLEDEIEFPAAVEFGQRS